MPINRPESMSDGITGGESLLRVLMVEDNPADAELCLRELRKGGYNPVVDMVEAAPEFSARLATGEYDVVISDFTLPAWNGMEAFEALQRSGRRLPFILVTGAMREEEAMQYLKQGMADYVHKDRLARIPFAVQRAIECATSKERCARVDWKWVV